MVKVTAPQARIWRPVQDWPAFVRPRALWPCIAETGSLTERLKAKAGKDFRVQLLKESEQPFSAEDAALLGVRAGERAFVRQVHLCGRTPWVYARSIGTLPGGGRILKELGKQPLGERAFADKATRRGPIQVGQVGPGHGLYQEAVAGVVPVPEGPLWARRSLLTASGVSILIYECFLPGMLGL